MYGVDHDPRDLLRKDRKEWSTNELSQLETLPIMHVRCTFNNTYIDICDHTGKILGWKSAVSIVLRLRGITLVFREVKLIYSGTPL